MPGKKFIDALMKDYYESYGLKWEPEPSKVEPVLALIVFSLMLGAGVIYITTLILS